MVDGCVGLYGSKWLSQFSCLYWTAQNSYGNPTRRFVISHRTGQISSYLCLGHLVGTIRGFYGDDTCSRQL